MPVIARMAARSDKKRGSKVIEDVDGGEPVIKFDGIEEAWAPLPKYDILEVEVAMAAPDETFVLALVNQRSMSLDHLSEPLDIGGGAKPDFFGSRAAQSCSRVRRCLFKRACEARAAGARSLTMKMLNRFGKPG
jgi:hypothetical protein